MVRFSAAEAAEGEEGRSDEVKEGEETLELQEVRLGQTYQKGLGLTLQGRLGDAMDAFKAALADVALDRDVSRDPRFSALKHIKYLCVKNLAGVAEKLGDRDSTLSWLGEAVALDGSDVAMWFRLGVAAMALDKLNIARCALERGITLRPQHTLCLEKLCEVTYSIGDIAACLDAAEQLIAITRPPSARAVLLKGMAMSHFASTMVEGQDLVCDAREEGGGEGGVEERLKNARATKRARLSLQEVEPEQVTVSGCTWGGLLDAALSAYTLATEAAVAQGGSLNVPVVVSLEPAEAKMEVEEEGKEYKDDEALCRRCGGDDEAEDDLLLCENYGACGYAVHRTCHDPPLATIPDGNWYCTACAASAPADLSVEAPQAGEECKASPKKRASKAAEKERKDGERKDGERKSKRSMGQRPPMAERLAGITQCMANTEDEVRAEAGSGNSFGAVEAVAEKGVEQGEQEEDDRDKAEVEAPLDPGVDLNRYQMAVRMPPQLVEAEAEAVRGVVDSLPVPCGAVHFAHCVLRAAAEHAYGARMRGTALEKLLALDGLVRPEVGGGVSAETALCICELRVDMAQEEEEKAKAEEGDAEERGGSGEGDRQEGADEGRVGQDKEWVGRLLAPLTVASFGSVEGGVRLVWLEARVDGIEKGPVASIGAYQRCKALLVQTPDVGEGLEILVPSCLRGNRISTVSVERRLKSPNEVLLRVGIEGQLEELGKIYKEVDRASEAGMIVAQEYFEALRRALIPEFQTEGRFLVTSLSEFGEKNKAGRDDRDEKLIALHSQGLSAGTEGGLREALYTLNLLLAEVVGIDKPAEVVADKEEWVLFTPLEPDGIRRVQTALHVLNGMTNAPMPGGCTWAAFGHPLDLMAKQCMVQTMRVVCRLACTKGGHAAGLLQQACALLYGIFITLNPGLAAAQRKEMLAPMVEELMRRNVHNNEEGLLLRVYLGVLNELRSSAAPKEKTTKMDEAEGSASDSEGDDEDDETDAVDKEIAKCYYALLDLKVKGFKDVYVEMDGVIGALDDKRKSLGGGNAKSKPISFTDKAMALDFFDFIQPRVERSIAREASSSFREALQAIVVLHPEPPAQVAYARESVSAYLSDKAVFGAGGGSATDDVAKIVEWFDATPKLPADKMEMLDKYTGEQQAAEGGEGGRGEDACEADREAVAGSGEPGREASDMDADKDAVIVIEDESTPRAGQDTAKQPPLRAGAGGETGILAQLLRLAGLSPAGDGGEETRSRKIRLLGLYRNAYRMLGAAYMHSGSKTSTGDAEAAKLFAKDLYMFPRRASSWRSLAEVNSWMLYTGSGSGLRHTGTVEASAEARVCLFRAARAYSALTIADPTDAGGRGGKGLMFYLLMQGMKRAGSPELRQKLAKMAMAEFEGIPEEGSDFKTFLFMGKLSRVLGRPAEEVVGRLWTSFSKYPEKVVSLGLEPLYTLHAVRARLALEGGEEVGKMLQRYGVGQCTKKEDGRGEEEAGEGRTFGLTQASVDHATKEQEEYEAEVGGLACKGADGEPLAAANLEVVRDCMVAMRAMCYLAHGAHLASTKKLGWVQGRYRLSRLMALTGREDKKREVSGAIMACLKPVFFNDKDQSTHTTFNINFELYKLKELEVATWFTLDKLVRLKVKTTLLFSRHIAAFPSSEALDRLEKLTIDTLFKVERLIFKNVKKRTPSSLFQAVHGVLSDYIQVFHARLAAGETGEDLFHKAGKLFQCMCEHHKTVPWAWEGLVLPLGPWHGDPRSASVSLHDEALQCPISSLLVESCRVHFARRVQAGEAVSATFTSASDALRRWHEIYQDKKGPSRLSLSSQAAHKAFAPPKPVLAAPPSPARGGVIYISSPGQSPARPSPSRSSLRHAANNSPRTPLAQPPPLPEADTPAVAMQFQIVLPEAARPGVTLEVKMPEPHRQRHVVVPEGYYSGMTLIIPFEEDEPMPAAPQEIDLTSGQASRMSTLPESTKEIDLT